MHIHIFGYGSLLNEESLRTTSPEAEIVTWATLRGYQRKMNAVCDEFPDVALNIVPHPEMAVEGVVVRLPEVDMPALQQREAGYEMVEVTHELDPCPAEAVLTFIAPNVDEYGGKKVYQEYIDICLGGVPEHKHEAWLAETIIECEVSCEKRPLI